MKSIGIVLLILLSATTVQPAAAEGSWWERGKELFKGISSTDENNALTRQEIAEGLREALRVGTTNVVEQLGQTNGYYNDPKAHIPLPESLASAHDALAQVGMSKSLDNLELRINRAAEKAAPRARAMFMDAIRNMSLEDVKAIYNGPEDAATRYFRRQMSQPLSAEFSPVVNDSLSQVGAIRTYDNVMSRYQEIPFVPDIKANLSRHVVDHAIEAIFDYLAVEEAAIRENPAKRTTALLQKVFSR